MSQYVYLDYAAATPLDERVVEVMMPYYTELFFNPSSPYEPAIRVRREYEAAKQRLAQCIGARGDDIVMTGGATESINLIFASVSGHVVTSAIEHHAVLAAAEPHDHTLVPVGASGVIRADDVAAAIRPDTQLVSVALANNELGTIQPIRDIAELVRAERQRRFEADEQTPIWLHCDASQGVGQYEVNVARLGVDAMTLNSGKIYGPKQVALLWADPRVELKPMIVGGGQERGLRSGTENVAGAVGFAMALEIATSRRKAEAERLTKMRDELERRLVEAFPDMQITGSTKKRLPGHLHVAFAGLDAERLVMALDMRGVLVATGSACAANKATRSHVLTAIGLEPDVADGSLRLTLGHPTTDEMIARAADIIIDVVRAEQARIAR